MLIEDIARVSHEVNRAYCKSLGDHSQPAWEDAPDWQKDSARNGVKFHLENPGASASASHNSWMKQKREEGWTYGPVKDPIKKEHHCMVEFEALPQAQQAKDFLFRGVVHALKPHFTDTANFKEAVLAVLEQESPELRTLVLSHLAGLPGAEPPPTTEETA